MARDGVRTLYLQTGNYEQSVDLVRPQALGRFIDAAHAAGMQVVAWYLPSFLYPKQDARRALAAIRFRSAKGERFDSFALDIEASLVKGVPLRSKRLLHISARLRAAVGDRYRARRDHPFPGRDPQASHLLACTSRTARWPASTTCSCRWPTPPTAASAASVATRAYNAADIAIIRARTGKPHVPIHLIGGLANAMGTKEVAGFMGAVADCARSATASTPSPSRDRRPGKRSTVRPPAPAGLRLSPLRADRTGTPRRCTRPHRERPARSGAGLAHQVMEEPRRVVSVQTAFAVAA